MKTSKPNKVQKAILKASLNGKKFKRRIAFAGYTDGKLYRRWGGEGFDLYEEYCIYKTKRQAKRYFEDVRKVIITELEA